MKTKVKNVKNRYIYLIIFWGSILTYSNTIPNEYAYDDFSVVQDNQFTVKGLKGIQGHLFYDSFFGFTGQKNLFRGGRYRPLSLITFSIEYTMFGKNPHASHLINIIIFGFICMLLFKVFTTLFQEKMAVLKFKDYFLSLSLMSVVIFACHPIHTEAVTNIKGRDELLALLFGLLAWNSTLKYVGSFKPLDAFLAGLFFFLSLMSKESSSPLLLLIPISLFCFRPDNVFRKSILWISVSLLSGFIIFILIRQSVVGWGAKPSMPDNILSNAFMYANGFSERYGTTFYTLGLYLKLLLFPHTLTIDYYPYYIPYVGLFEWKVILSIIVYTLLTVGAIVFTFRKNVAGYGFLFYLVAIFPVSNLLFPIGPFMGERFAFIPSVGFILAIVWLILKAAEKYRLTQVIPYFFILIIVLLSGKTISRNFEWKDNFTLFTTDVITSKNSAIITRFAGQEILTRLETETDSNNRKKYLKLAVDYLEQAEKLNKSTTETVLLGNAYCNNSEYEKALDMYSETLKMNKNYTLAYGNYLIAVDKLPSPELKIKYYDQLIRIVGDKYDPYYLKGFVFGKQLNNIDSSITNLNKAILIDSVNLECLGALGVVYALKGDFRKSLCFLDKAYKINPGDVNIVNNLIATLTNLGDKDRAQKLIGERAGKP